MGFVPELLAFLYAVGNKVTGVPFHVARQHNTAVYLRMKETRTLVEMGWPMGDFDDDRRETYLTRMESRDEKTSEND